MELFRVLATFAEPPGAEAGRLADLLELGEHPSRADYTDLFVLQLPPYASVYAGAEGALGGEGRERVTAFWRVLGPSIPTEPDHLAVLLALYAWLVEREEEIGAEDGEQGSRQREGRHHLRTTFLWEHLLNWLPPYLAKLQAVAAPAYAAWGALLSRVLREEAQRGGTPPPLSPHLRETPSLTHPGDGSLQPLVRGLLVPVQSGIILTRADLARAGHQFNLGIRVGERRMMLNTLLQQDGEKVLAWLSEEAAAWRSHHAAWRTVLGELAVFWEARAEATARLLATLCDEAAQLSCQR
ncbi:MAG: molecular chaperone TorD family protein [Chloroflexaceae bacterium]|nr:molecular chaperone TorD family protein [Chloroflexaceae bacterium]